MYKSNKIKIKSMFHENIKKRVAGNYSFLFLSENFNKIIFINSTNNGQINCPNRTKIKSFFSMKISPPFLWRSFICYLFIYYESNKSMLFFYICMYINILLYYYISVLFYSSILLFLYLYLCANIYKDIVI